MRGPQPSPKRGPPAASPPAKPGEAPATAASGPSNEALIQRYTAIVLSQPGAQFPLNRLAQLYRDRDGNLDALLADFEGRTRQPGAARWNALVTLAGLYKLEGQPERAIATYEQAIREQPKNSIAILALAQLFAERGDQARARTGFAQALPLLTSDADREQTLRTLLELSLDLKDYDAAKRYHKELVTRAKGSFFVRAELGRELLLRNEYERAATEYREVLKAATGDNRVLAPALRDLGRALAKLGKREEALKYLDQALRAAGGQAGVRREVFDIIVDVYRTDNKLRELIASLEKQPEKDADRLRLLGSLYEETGQVQKALEAYKKALGKDDKDVATHLKVIQFLQIEGELDKAIAEYETLIRVAPHNPDFVFQLAEALIQRGSREKALAELTRLEARSGNDEETLTALVDFYERIEEKARAREVLQRLVQTGSQDPHHLVELGDRHWQDGDKKKALATWARIRTTIADRALAEHTLGEVYLEHDMAKEGLEALREAVKLAPSKLAYRKAYALALERTGASASGRDIRFRQYEEARKIWDQLLKEGANDPNLLREARQHMVTLWSLSGQLAQRMPPLERRLHGSPPDLEAGRLLAEAQMRLRRTADAEVTLRYVVAHAKGDAASLSALERVLVQNGKLREAIEVLEKLVQLEPKRAREYYQRMAEHAAQLYRDDEAVRYAAKAVELSPDDADGHRKLGEMYRRRQEVEKAILSFRKALSKNDRLFPVYLQLSELLLGQGDIDEADQLLRRVVRSSPDEELVAQAARLSMQVNLGRGTLESLEKELLPVALGNPTKPLYRRLLVEIYGALTFPLVHQASSSNPVEAGKARDKLKQIGERAVKPLLDALGDERDSQQRIAIELLQHIENPSAGAALFTYATGPADPELRMRAMLALGSLRDPELLPKLSELLAPRGEVRGDESDPTLVAAAFAVVRMKSEATRPLLGKLLRSDSPSIRALAALGLGLLGGRGPVKELAQAARSQELGTLPRAAAAFALGELSAHTETDALMGLVEASDASVRAQALLALARLDNSAAPRVIADALVSQDPELQAAGTAAALVFATQKWKLGEHVLDVPDGRLDVRVLLGRLIPAGYAPADAAQAMVKLAPALTSVSTAAVQSSPERARAVADALLARDGKPAFGALTRDLDKVGSPLRERAEQAADGVARAVTGPFIALASHPASDVRVLALRFLGTRPDDRARQQIVLALNDPSESVQQAALSALGQTKNVAAADAVARLLESSPLWPVRVRAAETLAALPKANGNPRAISALTKAAESDEYALVRESAVRTLGRIASARARATLERIAKRDPEPRVQKAAQVILDGR